jgi:hypothetical protein
MDDPYLRQFPRDDADVEGMTVMRTQRRLAAPAKLAALGWALVACAVCSTAYPSDDGGTKTHEGSEVARTRTLRSAVERALPLLTEASAVAYQKHRTCFSCHNQAVPAVALALARRRGFAVAAETLSIIAEHTEADLNGAIDDYRKGKGQPGGVIRAGYALWTLEANGWPSDETISAVTHYLSTTQRGGDHWTAQSRRPPSESSDFAATALALRGLQAFDIPPPVRKPTGRAESAAGSQLSQLALQRGRALKWLEQAQPRETEDRVFRLWGMKYAGAPRYILGAAVTELTRTQRADGGWSQLDEPSRSDTSKPDTGRTAERAVARSHVSDAYATGSALAALHMAGGMAVELPVYQRGLDFLIRTQREDGSWFVKSRSHPFQTYFESGFPHGPDQFISAAGSAWAVAALALACPAP